MDAPAVEHSDSDSGESWTLLESGPAYGDDAPDFVEHPVTVEGFVADNAEKDEDTDGISIISDSDPESSTPCDLTYDRCLIEEGRPAEQQIPEFVSLNTPPLNNNDDQESVRGDEDFLGDSSGKLKTYVHRRNKRLSTMLNIIVLGSVITAAGVAVGHMWGARHDCALPAAPSVNKILSNLYKLQEENAHLRAKLRDLTLLNNMHHHHQQQHHQHHQHQRNIDSKQKCKKLFEESLTTKNVDTLVQCVDEDAAGPPAPPEARRSLDAAFERELLGDLDKLKHVYRQNKSWLDEEIAKRLKQEEQYVKKTKSTKLKSMKSTKINQDYKNLKTEGSTRRREPEAPTNAETILNVTEPLAPTVTVEIVQQSAPETRVTYADSLKSDHKVAKRDISAGVENNKYKSQAKKRKVSNTFDTISEISITDDEVKKDDRYVGHKYKMERGKKNDRAKMHKKQKRRNKYEQWEMKGGYLKDYDEVSVPSAHENDFVLRNMDRNHLSREFERNHYIEQFADSGRRTDADAKRERERGKDDAAWYEKRALLRGEARRRLEHEMFGEGARPEAEAPAAQWYFRRMARREQCRAAPHAANHTYKRLSKRILNFKTKH